MEATELSALTQGTGADWLTDKEYAALMELFHEFNAAFNYLPDYIKDAYFTRLYRKEKR